MMVWWYLLLVMYSGLSTSRSSCNVKCGTHAIEEGKTNVDGFVLQGYVIGTFDVIDEAECFTACIEKDCRCMSFNYRHRQHEKSKFHECELNSQDRSSVPEALVVREDWKYQDIINTPSLEVQNSECKKESCVNSCCYSNHCQHHSKCTVLCNTIRRFQCDCPLGLSGRFCEDVIFTTCADYLKQNTSLSSGMYLVKDDQNKEYYIFCDMDNNNQIAWTLVQSYAFRDNEEFKRLPFNDDAPFGDDTPNFERYRLSRNRMISIQNGSSLWRATCSYNQSESVTKTRDSVIGEFSRVDIFATDTQTVCERVVFINVRGFECTNCTTTIKRLSTRTVYIALKASADHCEFKADLEGGGSGEQSFGFYSTIRYDFSCSASTESTTNWWFGEKLV